MPISFSRRFLAAVLVAVCAVFCAAASTPEEGLKLRKVVIDAGHGGHDPGAISKDRKLYEKNVVLDLALMLGDKIKKAYPDVKVIYTRDKDVFIPLYERADIANKNHADLFISIHCNSVSSTAPSGFETYVMGMDHNAANMEVCKRENSVILLEDDYTARYQGFDPNDSESYIMFNLMQNAHFEQSLIFAELCQNSMKGGPVIKNRGIKQGALVVLWRSTMPSVLVEVGFISNPQDMSALASKDKRRQIAGELFNAFKKFKEQYELSGDVEDEKTPDIVPDEPGRPVTEPAEAPEPPVTSSDAQDVYFAVQVFAISKSLKPDDPVFKGAKEIRKFNAGKVFKYTAGTFKTEEEAAAAALKMAADFPGCFVVKIENSEIRKK
ncbi:MAG: N-acetylmuramoyl-L-alanine amidase [Bacteroidales bacterium]|nr:N-acetylmuramoyl-L-alanine amidase [Bacteroidales bacterium]